MEPTTETKFNVDFTCRRSGLHLGKFYPSSIMSGGTPYVQAWKDAILLHPIFAQSLAALLHQAKARWMLEKQGKRSYPLQRKQLMFLALLHASGSIIQDFPALPSAACVEINFPRLIEILSWKEDVNSDRLNFPKLRVQRQQSHREPLDAFANVGAWLQACDNCKDDYDNVVRERQKQAKKLAHQAAMRNIKRQMYADISIKRLWNWIEVQVPSMEIANNPELKELFFIDDDKVQAFQEEDITNLENMVMEYCELGNSISHEVMQRCKHLRQEYQLYHDTFEIVLEKQFQEFADQPAPSARDFPTRAAFLVATARWNIAQKTKDTPDVAGEDDSLDSEEL